MRTYNINKENIDDYLVSFDKFPEKISTDAGLDYNDGVLETVIAGRNADKRIVRIEITSFIGSGWSAMHYYGSLIGTGVRFRYIENPNCYTTNHDAVKENPLYNLQYKLELWRPVNKEEKEKDPNRWEDYDIGDFTPSFETKEEIIDLAKKCFRLKFSGDWELWVDDKTNSKEYKIDIEDE